jgi:hypothetical protein
LNVNKINEYMIDQVIAHLGQCLKYL